MFQLFKHQEVSVNRMQELEETHNIGSEVDTKIGFLSDIAGYGKSITLIQLLIDDLMMWNVDAPYEHITITSHLNAFVFKKTTTILKRLRASLLVIPKNLLVQWRKELSHTKLSIQFITNIDEVKSARPDIADVIVCTASYYNRVVLNYTECAWKRVIFDEPSAVKIPSMKAPYAGFLWFITSTPQLFYTSHVSAPRGTFFRDIIGDLSPQAFNDFIEYVVIRNDDDFVRSCYDMPKTQYYVHQCYFDTFKVVKHFITERIKCLLESGDIRGAVIALGGTSNDNIVELVRAKKEMEIRELDARVELYKVRSNYIMIEELNRRKAHIIDQIAGLNARFEMALKAPCPVCLAPLSKPLLESNCQNLFCAHCILQWLGENNNCPICRNIIHPESLVLVSDATAEQHNIQNLNRRLNKFEVIASLFKTEEYARILIFADNDAPFDTIAAYLRDRNVRFEKGNNAAAIDDFKNGIIQGLFLNTKTCSTGLDLVEASDVVLYHPVNEHIEYQIISRANRIGRTIPLKVHKLELIC